jgi:AcrR family transcriptional regulator
MQAPTPPATKGERTREHIFTTALALFSEKGYDATTMRDIAQGADCSLGLTYRYFDRKEELILEIYNRMTVDLAEDVENMPPSNLADQFVTVMRAHLGRIGQYRGALIGAVGTMLTPTSPVAVLGEKTEEIRKIGMGAFLRLVQTTTDAPNAKQEKDVALLVMHFGLLLYWFYDRTPNQRATEELLGLARDLLSWGRRVLRVPPVSGIVSRVARLMAPVFTGDNVGGNT